MAVNPLILKMIATAATDKNVWHVVAIAILSLLMPIILVVIMFSMLANQLAVINASLCECCFSNAEMPDSFTEEQIEAVEYVRQGLTEIETVSGKMMVENEQAHYDVNLIKAVFFSLQFGLLNDDGNFCAMDVKEFVGRFENASIDNIEDILQDISEDYSCCFITDKTVISVKEVYKYLNS